MRVDRARAVVLGWARLYTAGLPRPVADRRIEEIRADLHDQIAHERSLGVPAARVATHVTARAMRGAAADVAWRAQEGRTARRRASGQRTTTTATPTGSALRVGAFVLAVLAIPFVGMATSDEFDWSTPDFVLAGVLLGIIGVCFEAALRRRGNLLIAGIVAGLGVAAGAVGELDDAPGLVLLGVLMVVGGGAVAHRLVRRTG